MLLRVSEYIKNITGLHFPPERHNDLERAINNAKTDFGFNDNKLFIDWLLKTKLTQNQIKSLALHLTIGETYFFRDLRSMEIIRDNILPHLIPDIRLGKKSLKIWCAGCSTGEEPYSIAIWLKEILADYDYLDIKILASDINLNSLEKAKNGLYSQWSFRGTPLWVKNKYFKKQDNSFSLDKVIIKMVDFSYINLAENTYPSILNDIHSLDIILCRNVLMYFDDETYRKVVKKFHYSLLPDGWFFVNSVEVAREKKVDNLFKLVNFSGLSVYQKNSPELLVEHNVKPIEIYPPYITENYLPEPIIHVDQNSVEQKDSFSEALSLYKTKNYEQSKEILLELYDKEKSNPEIIKLLVNIYANQGQHKEAFEFCQKGLTINKIDPDFHYIMSNLYKEKKDIENSLSELRKVLYLNENHLLANYNLASIFVNKKDYKNALKYLNICKSILNKEESKDKIPFFDEINSQQMKMIIITQIEKLKQYE